ncbi:MAG: CBS domain-containing protein [Deltaproteobacteria bacterium]|nr:CBS domain-containing protein [Deltaproteobacteria bacterium]
MNAATIMTTNVATTKCGKTVAEAMQILKDERIRQMPIVDNNNKAIGLLASKKLLYLTLPRYISEGLLKDVKFAPDLPQFHKRCAELAGKDVCEVMDKEFAKIGPEVSVMEVATIFLSSERPIECILVVDNEGRLLGIISPWDIFKRLCEYTEKK